MVHAFQTLITSDAFPRPLLALAAPSILRLLSNPNTQRFIPKTLDTASLRSRARQAIGLPAEGAIALSSILATDIDDTPLQSPSTRPLT